MTQYAVPDSDYDAGNWYSSVGEDLFADVDEVPADDSDYISVTDDWTGSSEIAVLLLSNVTKPAVTSGHRIVFRASENSGMQVITLEVALKSGSVVVATFSEAASLSATLTEYSHDIDSGDVASYLSSQSDYDNLSIEITATDYMAAGTETTISQVHLELPDGATGFDRVSYDSSRSPARSAARAATKR